MSVPQEQMQQDLAQQIEMEQGEEEIAKADSRAARKLLRWAEKDNIVGELEPNMVSKIHRQITDQYGKDNESMEGWIKKYTNAIALAKMDYENTESYSGSGGKDSPFEGSAKVMAPILMDAATQWNARLYMDILASDKIVKPKTVGTNITAQAQQGQEQGIGELSPKDQRAKNQEEYINHILINDSDWKAQTDKQMMAHPIVGTTYKKVYYNPLTTRYDLKYVRADKIIFSQSVSTFRDAPQVACPETVSRNELVSNVHRDLWNYDLNRIKDDIDKQTFDIIEVYFMFDIDEDGYAEPWIATIETETETVMRIRAAFDKSGIHEFKGSIYWIDREEYIVQYLFIPDPEGGPMGVGWGILLNDEMETVNTNKRQLLDAGTIQNAAGNTGFIASNLGPGAGMPNRTEEGTINLVMGRFQSIQTTGGQKLRDSIVQFPVQGPSAVLFSLLQHTEEGMQRLMNSVWAIEPLANEAASMYLARIKQGAKVPNSQVGRFCDGLTWEFDLLYKVIFKYGSDEEYRNVLDRDASIKADFNPKDKNVVPNANPQQGSEAERMSKSQLVFDGAQTEMGQGFHNTRKVFADYYNAAGIEDVDSILPPQEGPTDFEKKQAEAQAKDAEFEDRKIRVEEINAKTKGKELELKTQETKVGRARQAKELQVMDSEIELNQAQAVKEIAGIEIDEAKAILELLRDDRQEDQRQQAASKAA